MKKLRSGVAIEQDGCNISHARYARPFNEVRRESITAIEPTSLRPTRSDCFYAATESASIPFAQVHQAVQETHDWESFWVERMREVNPLEDKFHAGDALAAFIADRDGGARNPSPENAGIQVTASHKRRLRHHAPLEAKITTTKLEQQTPIVVQQHQHVPLYRPIAVRACGAVVEQQPQKCCAVPFEIKRIVCDARSVSPITVSVSNSNGDDDSTAVISEDSPQQSNARRKNVRVHIEDDRSDYCVILPPFMMSTPNPLTARVHQAREGILYQLAISGGETDSTAFLECMAVLEHHHLATTSRSVASAQRGNEYTLHEGTWLTLTKPTFFGCLGETDAGNPMYALGRMTFDMFTPSNLICSLQGNFNKVGKVEHVPEGLTAQVGSDPSVLRTYNIITAFTIEPSLAAYPHAPNTTVHRPIRGLLTTTGYMMTDSSDSDKSQRNSLWITGGTMEPNGTPQDIGAWRALFGAVPPRSMGATAKLLAIKWLLGAVVDDAMDDDTSKLQYSFSKPIGGQGKAFTDTLYAESSLRIVRGQRGTLFVFFQTT